MKKLLSVMLLAVMTLAGTGVSAYAAKAHHRQATNRAVSAPVSVNRASADELTSLKGIGPKKAALIVAYRNQHGQFARLSDLTKVKGIGDKWVARLQKRNPGRVRLN